MLTDVHAHLTHPGLVERLDEVIADARAAGVGRVFANGTDARTNRAVLAMSARFEAIYPALGIYPIDACNAVIDASSWPHPFPPPERFDVDEEIRFIADHADRIVGVGECGLDRYWFQDARHDAEQERVFRALCSISVAHDVPLIIHTRKAEQRCLDVVREMGVVRCDFHCFGGKLALAQQIAEAGYYLSIPAVVERADSFQRMARHLPADRLLLETDAPYLSPDRGSRSEPADVARGCAAIAAQRGVSTLQMAEQLEANTQRLFGESMRRVDQHRGRAPLVDQGV